MTDTEVGFEEWVLSKTAAIAEARGVSVEDLAEDSNEVSSQIARVRQHFVAMGSILADASSWENKTRAFAVQETRRLHPELTSDERKRVADADQHYLAAKRIRMEVRTTMDALDKMHFESMNNRRTTFKPHHHDA